MRNFLRAATSALLLSSAVAYGSTCTAPKVTLPTIDAGTILVFGEVHGTREAPNYFLRAACAAVEENPHEPLLIGLEISISEQRGLDAFINSNGGAKAVQRFLALPFWNRSMQDGRSSRAMFDLIAGLRLLKQRSPNMSVTTIDDDSLAATRDESMAVLIDGLLAEHGRARALILTEKLHALHRSHSSTIVRVRSMVEFLRTPAQSLAFRSHGGHYWACAPLCGSQTFDVDPEAAVAVNWAANRPCASVSFDGLIEMGIVSESPPAIAAMQH